MKKPKGRTRGVFERKPGEWWCRYVDADGRLRREKCGTWASARDQYTTRKNQAIAGIKLPQKLRARVVPFSELCDDAIAYTKANNEGFVSDTYRMDKLKEEFGNRAAENIDVADFREFFEAQDWKAGTWNRARSVLFAIYRLGIENKKVKTNPAKVLKRQAEADGVVRFLNQYEPLPTKIDYLKPLTTEEARLRAVIEHDAPEHLDEFVVSVNTGMRNGEQFSRITWECVDFARKDLFIPQSKNGSSRHIPLNPDALAAFERQRQRAIGDDGVIPMSLTGPIFIGRADEALHSARHWFEPAVKKAGIKHFRWHDLRHTFASRLIMKGADITTVASLMGHKRIQMTMRYAHLAPEHKRAAVDLLSAFNG
jgi:integrase